MHAYNHPYALEKLSYEAQYEQLKRNFDHINNVTGKNPVSMSYPNNSYNKNTIKILNELNIISGFRSNMALVQSTNINKSLTIPRMDHSNILINS
jgi:peptidoglycan/xylan/chitin deacetylase (PgdA/CDA1 family)